MEYQLSSLSSVISGVVEYKLSSMLSVISSSSIVVVVVVVGQAVGSISSKTLAYDCLGTLEV